MWGYEEGILASKSKWSRCCMNDWHKLFGGNDLPKLIFQHGLSMIEPQPDLTPHHPALWKEVKQKWDVFIIKLELKDMRELAGCRVRAAVEWHRSVCVLGGDNMASLQRTAGRREWRFVKMAHHYGNLLQKHPSYSHGGTLRVQKEKKKKRGRGGKRWGWGGRGGTRVQERNRLKKCSPDEWGEAGEERRGDR